MMPTPVKKAALQLGLTVHEPTSLKKFTAEHAHETYDLFALASYGKILPAALLELPQLGALNVHPSLLPKYRGATPIQSALLSGDQETGVTIMLMDAGMDTGPIVLQERIPIPSQENYGALHDRLAQRGAELLEQVIERAKSGSITTQPQSGEPSVTKPIKKEDLQIDWNWSAERIVNAVRAYGPVPAARATIGGVDVKVLAAQLVPSAEAFMHPAADAPVYLTKIVSAGKPQMSGAAFGQMLERRV
jgi:methionyl-tRNA formyltransferase